jgi:molybdate transport system substrate-binding protein
VSAVQAAELQIIAGGGIAGPLTEIAAQFERASGHGTLIRYGTAPELIKMAMSGAPFDLAVVPRDVLKNASARAQVAPESVRDVARVRIVIAVRRGAPKPDISSPEALKQSLLKAESVASIPASATGTQLSDIYERLSITEEMQAKTKAQAGPRQVVEAVANGDAQLAVFGLNVLMDPGLEVVGPFPAELQREVVYAAGVAATSKQLEAAKALLSYLFSAPAVAVIKAKGMDPG